MGNFERCLPVVLKWEGGKVDNPKDPGGRTNQGVTQKVYDGYRRRRGMQQRDVYQLTNDERDEIYRVSYWNLIRGDQLPDGVDLVVFDSSVNSGVSRGIKWLQSALGVPDDGVLGPETMHALDRFMDRDTLVTEIINKRETFLRSLRTFSTFGKGWLNRTRDIEQTALAWASNGAIPEPQHQAMPSEQAHAKALEADMKPAPSKGLGDVATGAGVGTGVVTATVQGLQEQLTPFSMAGGWITKLVVALAIISAVLTIGGLAWRWYSMRKKKQIEEAAK